MPAIFFWSHLKFKKKWIAKTLTHYLLCRTKCIFWGVHTGYTLSTKKYKEVNLLHVSALLYSTKICFSLLSKELHMFEIWVFNSNLLQWSPFSWPSWSSSWRLYWGTQQICCSLLEMLGMWHTMPSPSPVDAQYPSAWCQVSSDNQIPNAHKNKQVNSHSLGDMSRVTKNKI